MTHSVSRSFWLRLIFWAAVLFPIFWWDVAQSVLNPPAVEVMPDEDLEQAIR